MKFDPWQQEMIDHEGNVTAACGRQVGKSTTGGKRRAKHMLKYPNSISLITAPSQRQSSELFIKTMGWLYEEHHKKIAAGGGYKDDSSVSIRRNMELRHIFEKEHGLFAEQPTKTMVKLKNGSICYALPAGKTGVYLRTYALDFLDIDEAAYMPEAVYRALKPMLLISMKKRGLGWESFYSTPYGRGGFFYDSFTDEDFKHFHISSEDCVRFPKDKLLKEKKKLPRMVYAQEYLGQFVDEFQQYFPTKLIKKCMTFIRWNFKKDYNKGLRYFLGHDYAGPGVDDNASVIAEMQINGKNLKIIEPEIDDEPSTTITNAKIVVKDESFKFNRIFVDSGGFGCGPTDELIKLLGRKVIGLDNAKKSIDHEGEIKTKILKQDLYSNARSMMDRGEVDIIDNLRLLKSLKSMTFRYTENKNLLIYGKDSHLAEAFVRACWAVKSKGLNLYIY